MTNYEQHLFNLVYPKKELWDNNFIHRRKISMFITKNFIPDLDIVKGRTMQMSYDINLSTGRVEILVMYYPPSKFYDYVFNKGNTDKVFTKGRKIYKSEFSFRDPYKLLTSLKYFATKININNL